MFTAIWLRCCLMRESSSIWPWTPRLKCLTNNKATLTWLTIRKAFWVVKVFRGMTGWFTRMPPLYWNRELYRAHSFTARSCARCVNLLKATWSTYCTDNSSYWMPVLFIAMWIVTDPNSHRRQKVHFSDAVGIFCFVLCNFFFLSTFFIFQLVNLLFCHLLAVVKIS